MLLFIIDEFSWLMTKEQQEFVAEQILSLCKNFPKITKSEAKELAVKLFDSGFRMLTPEHINKQNDSRTKRK